MPEIRFDTQGLPGLQNAFERAPGEISRELRATMEVGVELLRGEVVENTPVGATGLARRSMATDIKGQGVDLTGRVYSRDEPIKIASLEGGRKAGKMPPIAPIMLWARKKFGNKEAMSAAYAIQRAIGKRGTKGAKMFEKAADAKGKEVEKLFERRMTAVVKRVLG